MANKQVIKPAKSAPAAGPYNHAVRVGDLLFCAGQIPLDAATGNLVSGDIKAQTERALQNVKAILDDQGLSFSNVVKSTVFLTNLADLGAMNPHVVVPAHCTGWRAQHAMSAHFGAAFVPNSVGTRFEF